MISRKKFDPKNISVTEIDNGFNINYKDGFNLFFGEANLYDLTWYNPQFKIELVERLIQRTLEYIQENPNPNKEKL
jgi:hypothetical protein